MGLRVCGFAGLRVAGHSVLSLLSAPRFPVLDIYVERCKIRSSLINVVYHPTCTEGGETGSTEVKKLKLHAEVLAAR